MAKEEEEKERKVSYFAKTTTACPVCDEQFFKEVMFTGGGRLIAGNLSPELRRNYEKNAKFGRVIPMIYPVTVCPTCLYSALENDFAPIKPVIRESLNADTPRRQQHAEKLFGFLDFKEPRTLVHGCASYVLAIDCYEKRETDCAPTFKQALCALRATWLFGDLHGDTGNAVYKKIQDYYYLKAMDKYFMTLERMVAPDKSKRETIDSIRHFGPDTDQSYGFESILYLSGYLQFSLRGQIADRNELQQRLEKAKIQISKVFGTGKASKGKPSILIDMTRELYDSISDFLKKEFSEQP